MKQLFLMSASFLIASGAFAQMDASDNTLYKFDNTGSPKEVRKLGSAPEFPFLRNLTSSRQVYNAIKSHNNAKLNDLLMQIGYENGAKDLQPSDITEAWVPVGTEGNMGSRGYTYGYYKLAGDPAEFKAWKIQPNEGSTAKPLYLFSKCGNAFYPNGTRTACISVPVNVTPDMKQVNLPASGSEVTTTDKVYVYYAKKRHNKDDQAYPVAGVEDKYISKPIQVNSMRNSDVVPETYTVSLSSRANDVTACTDKTLDLTANVNVEKTSTYTGNYPKDDHKVYKKVSKHQYKVIARKMRKAQKKADKIARRTETSVEVRTEKKA
jgi:hypothetical protein